MRFLLLKTQSQYGSLALRVEQLAAALTEIGEDAVVIDAVGERGRLAFHEAVREGADCVIAFNGVLGPEVGAELGALGIVYVSLYVDHPLHHLSRLEEPRGCYAALFLDRTHQTFMTQLAKPGAFAHLGFVAPGAATLPAPVDVSPEAYARRDIPILFSGTYRGEPERPWLDFPEPARSLLDGCAQRMAADGALEIITALRRTLDARAMGFTPDFLRVIAPALTSVQSFTEAYHRNRFLEIVGEAGIEIQVVGKGWQPLCDRYPHLRNLGEGSFEETLLLLRRTRVVINVNNSFVAGGHERVFAAMAGGAAVFSETSLYYRDVFRDGQDVVLFSTPATADVADRLRALASDIAGSAAIAAAGHAKTMAEHQWVDRAGNIVSTVQSLKRASLLGNGEGVADAPS